jgi:hypothetical protein
MRTNKLVRKMTLNRETLRFLENGQLSEAAGGTSVNQHTCPYTCQRSCSCLTNCL